MCKLEKHIAVSQQSGQGLGVFAGPQPSQYLIYLRPWRSTQVADQIFEILVLLLELTQIPFQDLGR